MDQLPRLQSHESHLMVERLAVGTGAARSDVASSILRAWERHAGPSAAPAPAKPADLAAMGIGYREVRRRG